MSFDWSQYFTLAKELATGQQTSPLHEAKLRSACSRAYYAAFCLARNLLANKDRVPLPPDRSAHHKFVPDRFRSSPDALRQKIGLGLNRLRVDRNKADYDDSVSGLSTMTQTDIMMAQNVITMLGQL